MMKLGLDNLKTLSILYAEDDDTVRESTVKTLSVFFGSVKAVSNGADAISAYEQMKPNIVMLDIRMPLINGLEVASLIREKDLVTPIIIATSYKETDDILKAVKLNLADYIIKPFSFEDLRVSLMESLKRLKQNGLIYRTISEGLTYDFTTKTFDNDGSTIILTKNEVAVFERLLSQKGSLVTYAKLEEALGLEFEDSKASIKNTVLRLRKKIGKELIANIQDLGYMLV